MKQDNKKLYESIMASVAREVKKVLNENEYSDAIQKMEEIEKEMQQQRRKFYSEELGISSDENIKKAQNALIKCHKGEITQEQLDSYLDKLKG